jgi:hypothetical protein
VHAAAQQSGYNQRVWWIMELELHRVDLLQTAAAAPGTLVVRTGASAGASLCRRRQCGAASALPASASRD